MFNFKKQQGFAAFFVTFLVMAVIFSIAVSIFIVTHSEHKIIQSVVKSNQAQYAAEAGVEDILLRLIDNKNWSSSYALDVDGVLVHVTTSDMVGGTRIIDAQAESANRFKKIQIVYQITTDKVSFYYGAQVGDGGMIMESGSKVIGNVFSNGSVSCPVGKAYITNSLIVAGSGNKIENMEVGDPNPLTPIDEARAHSCFNCLVHGVLYYVSGGTAATCSADAAAQSLPNNIAKKDLPISDAQINLWKDQASCNGNPTCIFIGNYNIPGGNTELLGPLKIVGDLMVNNNSVLSMTGTIYVTGDIILSQNSTVELDLGTYNSLSGIMIADGQVEVQNNAVISGSGDEGSYVILLSTNSSLDENNAAIDVKNSAEGAIFYTSEGVMRLRNNMKIREATGYKVYMDQNAEIEYETGLSEASFTSGPGGSWAVVSWKEIE